MSKTVGQLLEAKGREVFGIAPDATVYEALSVMAERNVGAVVVLGDGGTLVGILSERDYARKVILADRNSRETPASDIMTAEVETVRTDATTEICMALMTRGRFRHLPVVDDGVVIGVVSIGDIVKAVIEEQEALIDDLERYITG